MTVGQLTTEIRNVLDGFNEKSRLILRNKYMYQKIGRAVLEVKKDLGVPIRERSDLTTTTGERTLALPSDFMELLSVRMDYSAANDFEGYLLHLVKETDLAG